MRRVVTIFIVIAVIFTLANPVLAVEKDIPEIIILSTTDEQKDDFAILEESRQNQSLNALIDNSFMKKSLQIYSHAQKYAKGESEPFYLSFKPNSGEYGKIGFYLKKDGVLLDKTSSPYIELNSEELTSDPARLQSLTQIFPHEMGHILIGLTIPSMNVEKIGSLEMHNSNVITDYSTAFNEGFAEHFEIIARQDEENNDLKLGIYQDLERTSKKIEALLPRAERDFTLPLRMGYYRGAALLWVNRAEGLKRDRLPINGECVFKNSYRQFSDPETTILLRNIGLKQDAAQKRTLQQALSTESVISRFFLLLYQDRAVPMLEHYGKVLGVFNNYVGKDLKPPLIQFMNGYCIEYSQEKDKILGIYRQATGYDFADEIIPEIWMISSGDHIRLAMDQFGAMTCPLYIFNLNTCETEDLLTLYGMEHEEAQRIIEYRDRIRFFKSPEELQSIENINDFTRSVLRKSTLGIGWSEADIKQVLKEVDGLSHWDFSAVIISSLKHYLFRTVIWFAWFYIIYFLLILRKRGAYVKRGIIQFSKLLLFSFAGLLSSILSAMVVIGNSGLHPVIIFAVIISIIELVKLPFLVKNKPKLRDGLISTLIMSIMIVYSLI